MAAAIWVSFRDMLWGIEPEKTVSKNRTPRAMERLRHRLTTPASAFFSAGGAQSMTSAMLGALLIPCDRPNSPSAKQIR
ncbi:MAG: hypothetical protein BWX45_01088 [Deltaproteobacteria bacterium ADurb.Bin002]|nr:MAG: hypothetical protein BWX45_01088 [Deltaproteobacteria bacterium ADurb.Bin002]